jgi:O-methyltransferase
MSSKRDLVGRLFPKGVPFSESINDNAVFVAVRRERFSNCPEFGVRLDLYKHLASIVGNEPIDYLEFGVWKGDAIDAWRRLNTAAESRFVGFDTFEGLPEDWEEGHPKGTFSTHGATPHIDDPRVSFVKGLFQKTLLVFLEGTKLQNRLVINVDCDLYSATLYVLTMLDRYFRPGTIIIFDDFYSMSHEFKAFVDYDRSYGRQWRALGRMPHCMKAAIEICS